MKTLALLTTLTVVLLIAASSSFAGVLSEYDCFNDGGSWFIEAFYENYIIAQTFVPTVSGVVSSIEAPVAIHSQSDPEGIPISFKICSTWNSGINGIQPKLSDVLSTGQIEADDPQFDTYFICWKTIQMSPVTLEAGQKYAIVASAIGTDKVYDWYSKANGSGYSEGRVLLGRDGDTVLAGQNRDVAFVVNAVPEPGSILALLSGLVGLGGIKLRKK